MRRLPLGALVGALWLGSLALLAWSLVAAPEDPLIVANEEANERYALGDFSGALARYRELQRDRPDLLELSVNAGNALHGLAQFPRALTNYDHALGSPDGKLRAIAHYDRGNTLYRMGRLDEAREAYKAALREDGADRDAKFNIEFIDGLREAQRRGQQQAGPGEPGQGQGGQQQPGQPQPGGSPQPGQQPGGQPQDRPAGSPDPSASPPPRIDRALEDFRRSLNAEEAIRLLDALRAQQRGVQVLIEGQPPRRGGPASEPLY